MLLPLALFWSVTIGGNTLLPVDNLFQYAPFHAEARALGVGAPQNHLLSDLILENYEWKRFILDALSKGELPLWNPYLFGGVPFLAAGQHSALYPLSVLYYVLPLASAYGWFTVVNLGLAGVFMFILVRGYGLRRGQALMAGAAYQLGGFLITSVVFQMMIAAAAWLPLILALCDKIIFRAPGLHGKRSHAQWVILGACAIAFQIYAGHVEITVYTALVAAAYCAHRLFWSVWRKSADIVQPALWLVVMVVLGGALGALQLVPLFELLATSFRAERAEFATVLSYGFPKSLGWIRWLVPNFFGSEAQHTYFNWFSLTTAATPTPSGYTFWDNAARWKQSVEGGAYVGLPTLILAMVATASWMTRAIRPRQHTVTGEQLRTATTTTTVPIGFFVLLALFSVAFVFGTPLYALLYYGLPGINQLHSPFRWVFPLTVCLVVLAAVGLNDVATLTRQSIRVLAGVCAVLGVGLAACVTVLRLTWPAPQAVLARAVAALELDKVGFSPDFFFSFEASNFVHLALVLVAVALLFFWLASARSNGPTAAPGRYSSILGLLPALIVVVDCVAVWSGFNPSVAPKLLTVVPPAINFLLQDKTLWRMTTFDQGSKPLNANSAWMFNLQDVRGYDSIIPKRYVAYMQLIERQDELPYNRISPLKTRAGLESPLLDLLNVKYILSDGRIDPPVSGLTEVYHDAESWIYQNERVLPRAFTLPLTAGLLTNDFGASVQTNDPRKFVMIDASCGVTDIGCVIPRASAYQTATITSYTNNEVWVDLVITESSWLMLTDSYFEGWRATVRPTGGPPSEEREVPILPANGNFRAVRLDMAADGTLGAGKPAQLGSQPAGLAGSAPTNPKPSATVTVRFRYVPDSLRLGAFVSAIAAVILVFGAGTLVWRTLRIGHDTEDLTEHSVRRVARNSLTLTALNMLARLIDMAFALVMLRYLGPGGNGNFTFAVVIVSWFEILMNFGLNTFLIRDASRDRAHATSYFYKTTALRLVLALVAAPLVALVIVAYTLLDGITADTRLTIALLVLSQLPGSLATGLSALFYAYEKAEIPAGLTIVSAIVKVILGAGVLVLGLGIVGLAIVSIVTNVLTMVLLFGLAGSSLNLNFSAGDLRHAVMERGQTFPEGAGIQRANAGPAARGILREAFPLMINHLLSTIFFKIDVPMLRGFTRDASQVGFYSVGYKYVDALNIIPSLFTQSLFPAMSRMAAQSSKPGEPSSFARAYVLATKLLVILALPLSVAISFLATPMIGLLGGPAFLPQGALSLAIVIWHMPVGWINSVTNYALIASGQQRLLTRAFMGAVLFNVAANLFAIPAFGFVGAAVVTVLSEVVQLITFYVYVRQFIVKVNWLDVLAKPFLGAGLMAAVMFVASTTGLLLPGLLIGLLAYLGVIFGMRSLTGDERDTLRPLLPARLRPR